MIERPFCAHCGVRFEVPAEDGDVCPACLVEPPDYTAARAVVAYDAASKGMILEFKHGDQTHLTTTFTPWLARIGAEFRPHATAVVPVPLYRWRLWRRRYNQAGLLARALARVWGVPYVPQVLKRVKPTASQGHLTALQRHENVAGAFAIDPVDRAWVKGQSIVLIDDVYTTGATVKACARVLKKAGAERVDVLTLARVMRTITVDGD
jgi:ComF family protein